MKLKFLIGSIIGIAVVLLLRPVANAQSPFWQAAQSYAAKLCRNQRQTGLSAIICYVNETVNEHESRLTSIEKKISEYDIKLAEMEEEMHLIQSSIPTPTATLTPTPTLDPAPFEATFEKIWNGNSVSGTVYANKPLKECSFQLYGGSLGIVGSGSINGSICTAQASGLGSTKFYMRVESIYGETKEFGDIPPDNVSVQ